jgi:hypothetical protein
MVCVVYLVREGWGALYRVGGWVVQGSHVPCAAIHFPFPSFRQFRATACGATSKLCSRMPLQHSTILLVYLVLQVSRGGIQGLGMSTAWWLLHPRTDLVALEVESHQPSPDPAQLFVGPSIIRNPRLAFH